MSAPFSVGSGLIFLSFQHLVHFSPEVRSSNRFLSCFADGDCQWSHRVCILEDFPAIGDWPIKPEKIRQATLIPSSDCLLGDKMPSRLFPHMHALYGHFRRRQPKIDKAEIISLLLQLHYPRGEALGGQRRFKSE